MYYVYTHYFLYKFHVEIWSKCNVLLSRFCRSYNCLSSRYQGVWKISMEITDTLNYESNDIERALVPCSTSVACVRIVIRYMYSLYAVGDSALWPDACLMLWTNCFRRVVIGIASCYLREKYEDWNLYPWNDI